MLILNIIAKLRSIDSKVISLDSDSDGLNLLHKISQHRLIDNKFNEIRPYLVADRFEIEPYKHNVIILNKKWERFFHI